MLDNPEDGHLFILKEFIVYVYSAQNVYEKCLKYLYTNFEEKRSKQKKENSKITFRNIVFKG